MNCLEMRWGYNIYLTSAKVEGRSTIRAPPKSGVLRKLVILRVWSSFGVLDLICIW